MIRALNQLPDDVDSLKSLLARQSEKLNEVVAQNEQLQAKTTLLQEQLHLALARRYAASSEKISPDKIRLFDEAEVDAAMPAHAHLKFKEKVFKENLKGQKI